MNKLLRRQIEKYLGSTGQIPKELNSLFNAINSSYDDFDKDRKLLERSLDITSKEMMDINKRLKKSEKKFKTYLDLAKVIMIAIDTEGVVTYINKRGCETLKFEKEDIIGKNWFDNFIPGDRAEEIRNYSRQIFKNKEEKIQYKENEVVNGDGEKRLIAWYNILLTDENGKVTGALSSGDDITEDKAMKDELNNKIKELESFYKIATGREMKMIELKKKIKKLEEEVKNIKKGV